jgi:hypothetical protein
MAFSLALVLGAGSARADDAPPTAVLELFTSQGCSSCPSADVLHEKLTQRPGLVVISLPVDYWDYLGWKDTLASPMFSARQRAYAMERGDRQVYTPQTIINGRAHALGSDLAAIEAGIASTRAESGVLSLPVKAREAAGKIEVELPKGTDGMKGEVWLLAVSNRREVAIGRGENADRRVTYAHVVRKMTRLGAFKGKDCRFAVARADAMPSDADRALVIVQAGNGGAPGAILGAAWAKLTP